MAAITQVVTAPAVIPTIDHPETFEADANVLLNTGLSDFAAQLVVFASQANTLAAAMNAAAAGGAMATRYTFSTTVADADPTPGKIRLSNATQNLSTVLRLDLLDAAGSDWSGAIDLMDDSTSAVKGFIRVGKAGDGTKYLIFAVASLASPAGYRNISAACVASSSANPFADGDMVEVEFTRTGDKGDQGLPGTLSGTAVAAINWAAANTIASAATTDIGAATSNYVIVTGTTAITSLGVIAQGAERVVRFSGATTLTYHAANLVVPGAANIVTAAGDIGRFVSEGGGAWRCTAWTPLSGLPLVTASQAEATAGTENTKPMTALRVAQAIAALAGSGVARVARAANTAFAAADKGKVFEFTSTFTQTFAAAATLGAGWSVFIANMGTGDITLDPNGAETIDALASFIHYPGEVRLLTCDGATFESVVLKGFEKTFAASGTFTKPPGYMTFGYEMLGGGGGGGGGCRGPTSTIRSGGTGGGGGAYRAGAIASAALGATAAVVVGAGGTAGAGAASASTVGGNGGAGGTSTIALSTGYLIQAFGGGRGVGGPYTGAYNQSGGGGGGVQGAGASGTTSVAVGGLPLAAVGAGAFGGGRGGYTTSAAESSGWGGGGGGGTDFTNFAACRPGANSVFGGAGGGTGGSVAADNTAYPGGFGGYAGSPGESSGIGPTNRRCGGQGGNGAYISGSTTGAAGGIGAGGGGGGGEDDTWGSGTNAGGAGGAGEVILRGIV